MSRHSRRLALAAGLVGLVAAAGSGVAPASAHATVTITAPDPNQLLTAADTTVTGQVTLGTHSLLGGTTVTQVNVTVATTGHPDVTASAAPDSGGGVSIPVHLAYNGRYQLTLTAPWTHTGLVSPPSGTAADSRPIVVAALPARPTGVKVAVDATARTVAVSWKANTEPDLLFYLVQRAKGTSTDFTVLGKAKASETSFSDATTAGAGGDYRYEVVAVRDNGLADGNAIASDPSALSADATAKVPDPPPPPTAAPGSSVPVGTGTAATLPANSPGALTSSGTVDLSGFNTVRAQTKPVTPRTLPLPDPGFQNTLPFAKGTPTTATAAGVPGSAAEDGATGQQALERPLSEVGADSGTDHLRTMAFFAGGLLTTVLLMHVLWVRGEVRRTPLEAIDPDGPLPAVSAAGRPARAGRSGPYGSAGPTLEDAGGTDFAPVVVAGAQPGPRPRSRGNRRPRVTSGS